MRRHAGRTLALLLLLSFLVASGPTLIAAQQGTPEAQTSEPETPTAEATETATTEAAATSAPGTAVAPATNPAGEAAGAEWTTYGGNLFDQRYSALDQIDTGNVAQLKGAWTFETGVKSDRTSFESSPIVVDGVMYLTGPHSQVFALDAKTGKQLWKYVPKYDDMEDLPLCCGQTNRGVAVGGASSSSANSTPS